MGKRKNEEKEENSSQPRKKQKFAYLESMPVEMLKMISEWVIKRALKERRQYWPPLDRKPIWPKPYSFLARIVNHVPLLYKDVHIDLFGSLEKGFKLNHACARD